MTNSMMASREWATRSDDERFESLDALKASVAQTVVNSRTGEYNVRDLHIDVADGSPVLRTPNRVAQFTHWSFGQFCSRVKAPAAFIRTLAPETAAIVLNEKIADVDIGAEKPNRVSLLGRVDTNRVIAATSDSYSRVWNADVIDRLKPMLDDGWRVPPARPVRTGQKGTRRATAADVMACSFVREGEEIAPAGLYAGDRDMFCYFVNPERRIEDGSEGGLFRGFFLVNSEVGAKALKILTFLFRGTCGNHIIHGMSTLSEINIRHVGQADRRSQAAIKVELKQYADAASSADEADIVRLQTVEIAKSKDEVVEAILSRTSLARLFSAKTLDAAYETCVIEERALSPRSPWGLAQGLTSMSQNFTHADERAEMDKAAGALLAAY
jgi:hypothetical protein